MCGSENKPEDGEWKKSDNQTEVINSIGQSLSWDANYSQELTTSPYSEPNE
jgi:hypothetical protein